MATTAIWGVKGWLGRVVVYIENPEKTENPAFFEQQGMSEQQRQGLSDVIDYAVQTRKTAHNEDAEVMRRFVTGVNCQPETAREEMLAVKRHYSKDEGIVAFHGYQSFAPGEVTPDMAHEIGVKLAEQLWGERFQVIIATHLDKAHHLHNHFVINSVSFLDGYRYNDCTDTYSEMRQASDALCREYGLSVIENPKRGKSKHYAEWNAERENKPTWRSLVKSDVDAAIRQSMTETQLFANLKQAGYEVKIGKDISVRPPGKERFVRLHRNFGDDYAIEAIRKRILAQNRPERRIIPADPPKKHVIVRGNVHKARKLTGLRALYFYYLYRMGVLPRKRQPNPKQVYFLFREDIRHMQDMAREIRLLAKYGINTAEQLAAHKDGANAQITELSGNRKRLRNQTRSIRNRDSAKSQDFAGKGGATERASFSPQGGNEPSEVCYDAAAVKTEISKLTAQITELRREVRLCENIETRSLDMKDKIHRVKEAEKAEKSKTKEMMKREPFRGRR